MKRDPHEYVDHVLESMAYIEQWVADGREHDYLGLNLERIWDIATIQLPELKPHVGRIAADLGL